MAIINVISGKGGTGKSLLTIVLGRALAREGLNVLLIDFDIFVRGLTILLMQSASGKARSDGMSVTELLGMRHVGESNTLKELLIRRFLECDVLPAVSDINAPINYDEELMTSPTDIQDAIKMVFSRVREMYEVVLVDSRSGIDSFILASVQESDIALAVAEDDEVSLQTNTNLMNHLRYRRNIGGIFTIINKARRITSYDDIKRAGRDRRVEFSYVGVVPFDIEILQDYGTERFWQTVNQTLYFRAIIDAWNEMADQARIPLPKISASKYKFGAVPGLQSKRFGRLGLIERVMMLYGILTVFSGVAYWAYDQFRKGLFEPAELILFSSIIMGVLMMITPVLGLRRFLIGSSLSEDDAARPRG